MEEKRVTGSDTSPNASKEDLEAATSSLQRGLQSRHLQFIAIGIYP